MDGHKGRNPVDVSRVLLIPNTLPYELVVIRITTLFNVNVVLIEMWLFEFEFLLVLSNLIVNCNLNTLHIHPVYNASYFTTEHNLHVLNHG